MRTFQLFALLLLACMMFGCAAEDDTSSENDSATVIDMNIQSDSQQE